jgi:hypothetical protein
MLYLYLMVEKEDDRVHYYYGSSSSLSFHFYAKTYCSTVKTHYYKAIGILEYYTVTRVLWRTRLEKIAQLSGLHSSFWYNPHTFFRVYRYYEYAGVVEIFTGHKSPLHRKPKLNVRRRQWLSISQHQSHTVVNP